MRHIDRRFFSGLFNLESLDLSSNPELGSVDSGLFRGLFSLKDINLSNNELTIFDLAGLFKSCRLIESLDLSNNRLDHRSVNEAAMAHTVSLKVLNLASNRLENMDFARKL